MMLLLFSFVADGVLLFTRDPRAAVQLCWMLNPPPPLWIPTALARLPSCQLSTARAAASICSPVVLCSRSLQQSSALSRRER